MIHSSRSCALAKWVVPVNPLIVTSCDRCPAAEGPRDPFSAPPPLSVPLRSSLAWVTAGNYSVFSHHGPAADLPLSLWRPHKKVCTPIRTFSQVNKRSFMILFPPRLCCHILCQTFGGDAGRDGEVLPVKLSILGPWRRGWMKVAVYGNLNQKMTFFNV